MSIDDLATVCKLTAQSVVSNVWNHLAASAMKDELDTVFERVYSEVKDMTLLVSRTNSKDELDFPTDAFDVSAATPSALYILAAGAALGLDFAIAAKLQSRPAGELLQMEVEISDDRRLIKTEGASPALLALLVQGLKKMAEEDGESLSEDQTEFLAFHLFCGMSLAVSIAEVAGELSAVCTVASILRNAAEKEDKSYDPCFNPLEAGGC